MNGFITPKKTSEMDLLIAFADLTNFSKIISRFTNLELFDYIARIYELSDNIVENGGGKLIKFIGDESLSIFSELDIDKGIISLLNLKSEVDKYNKSIGIESQLKIKCHYGSVAIGFMGSKSDKRIDIMGNEVNNCAIMKSNGFALSAEVFRKLNSETRKYFKKHTPPITYIPIENIHND